MSQNYILKGYTILMRRRFLYYDVIVRRNIHTREMNNCLPHIFHLVQLTVVGLTIFIQNDHA